MPGIASLRDVEAIEAHGLPADLPASTYEMLQRGAALDPRAPALSFFLTTDEHRKPETWTYADLLARITQTANFFDRIGVRKDSVVAFVLPNLPETHFVIWGGQAAGIVAALNPLLEGAALAELLAAANATVLVTLAPFPGTDLWAKLQPHLANVRSLKHLVLVNLPDRVRGWKKVPARLLARRETARLHGRGGLRGAVPASIRIHDLNRAIARETGERLNSGRRFSKDDESSYFCTGGTTGLPKIAMRRHGNEVANAWSASQFLGDGIGAGKVVFCGLPLFHVNGVLVTGLMPFSKGAHIILGTPQGYRGEGVVARFWEIVAHHRVNFFSGVPTLYASLLQVPIGAHDLGCLEYGLCGAAPMPVEVFRTFQERTGLKILEGYGLTEATCVSSVNPPLGERRLGSIGLRIPGQRMKAVVLDERGVYQRDCATGEVGVLVVCGPNVFAGYRAPEQNKGLWIDCGDGERWLNTGDLGRQDAEGYFWMAGRRKELIIRGGHNIDPLTIEEPLHRHPAVEIAAAVGRPDAHAGELPVAYVQLRAGASATEAELAEFLKAEIAERAALPKAVRIVEKMPLTAVGKIFKPALKHRETREALEAALRDAGIAFRGVAVADDKTRGLVVRVDLASGDADAAARSVLGRFAFPFELDRIPEVSA
ncbi:MAG TPA: acyl-CoA synthetase [Nevskiaceae bacterium]|nr:acyl-CoA synthetase [Nevskiaceae bacterium]